MQKITDKSCPHCQSHNTEALGQRTILDYRRWRCHDCNRQFNERTGTPFNRLHVPTDVARLSVAIFASS
jgi:putative transposase